MKIVNNFERISSYMDIYPLKEGEFYLISILYRGKDGSTINKNGNNKNRLIKSYYVKSSEHLKSLKDEIISISNICNARVYFYPSKRSFKEVADKFLELFPSVYLSNPEGIKYLYDSACGQSRVEGNKLFLVDIDTSDLHFIRKVKETINSLEPEGNKIVLVNPTLNGFHIISTPFNTQKFKEIYEDIDIHKNNPTLLYYNSNCKT